MKNFSGIQTHALHLYQTLSLSVDGQVFVCVSLDAYLTKKIAKERKNFTQKINQIWRDVTLKIKIK